MARHALVNQAGLVVNVLEWEGAEFKGPDGHYIILAPGIDIGDFYNFEDDVFIKPDRTSVDPVIEPEEPLSLESLKQQLEDLKASLNK